MSQPNIDYLVRQARHARHLILDMIYTANASHIGGALSCIDILVALYFGDILRINPENPKWKDRDKFILSKGHGCTALYATLALKGFFPREKLHDYGKDGSVITSHVTLGCLPGIEATAGSEGHGLSLGIGMALAARNSNQSNRVFVIVGDGECQEGSVWEGASFAGHHKINNLILIVDKNEFQIMGRPCNIVAIDPLDKRFSSFGWDVEIINGHNFTDLVSALSKSSDRPRAVIANTIKGKGISFMEDQIEWHGKCPNEKEYMQAKKELGEII